MGTTTIIKLICGILKVNEINFLKPENFIKLLDLIFQYRKHFNLTIMQRQKNFLEDTLRVFYEELEEVRTEHPLQVKEFASIVRNEQWV